jgi:endonuclease YncB( thermonuclease family)
MLAGEDQGYLRRDDFVRSATVDTYEIRTRDLHEKTLGLEAKKAVEEWIGDGLSLWLVSWGQREFSRGKYGRLLGELMNEEGQLLGKYLESKGLVKKTLLDSFSLEQK